MSFSNYLNKMNDHKIEINSKLEFWKKVKEHGSKGEQITRNFLRKYNISFKEQKSFNDLWYKNKEHLLRYDFQIWINEKDWFLLEIQGGQHYKPVNFGGSLTEEQIQKNFEEGIERDNIKKEYCEKHNIKLEFADWNGNKDKLIKDLTIIIRKYKK